MAPSTDLERAYKALSGKRGGYDTLFDYYLGDQPLIYSAERLREVFQRLDSSFTQNWCGLVVDSVIERMNLKGLVVDAAHKAAHDELQAVWDANHIELDSDDAHTAALVTGESFVIVWPDETGATEVYYNDPRLCHVFYDAAHPRRKAFAVKWWQRDDGKLSMTLYYPDRLERYVSTTTTANTTSANNFEADPDAPVGPNPYGAVPVFHFRRSLQAVTSELKSVLPLQDAVNKLLADMMVAAEFGAFRQRWIISNADNLGALKNSPAEIWDLPSGDGVGQQTQVGEFSATDLGNFLDSMDKLTNSIAVISRMPKHYFLSAGAGVSGEALLAMEAPLNGKAMKYQELFTPVWKEIAAFVLQLSGMSVEESEITAVWDDVRTIQPWTEAQIRKVNVEAGMPLVTTLRREGWAEDELAQLEEDQEAASGKQQASLATALVDAQRRMDQGEGAGQPGQMNEQVA